jgi:hypothetical protein
VQRLTYRLEIILESYEPWESKKSSEEDYKEWRKRNPRPASPAEPSPPETKKVNEEDSKAADALRPGQMWDFIEYTKRNPGPYEQCGEDHCTGKCLHKGQ